MFLSREYPEKDWPSFELEIGKEAKSKRTTEYLLPILIDDVHIVGMSKDVGYLDLRKKSMNEVAEALIRKIESAAASLV